MDEKIIKLIDAALQKGYCVELRPVKDGTKIIKVIREQIGVLTNEKQNHAPSP